MVVNLATLLAHHGVYLSSQGFFYYIADESMGGVYMTLCNSLFNLGTMWVDTASLKILGVMDRNLEIGEDYCKKYENGTGVYDPKGNRTTFYMIIIIKNHRFFISNYSRIAIYWLGQLLLSLYFLLDCRNNLVRYFLQQSQTASKNSSRRISFGEEK